MFKFFESKIEKSTKEPFLSKNEIEIVKSVNEIIEEIHETFFTEHEKLMETAKITNSLGTNKEELIKKADRLYRLGFTSTKEVKEASLEKLRLYNLKIENKEKGELIEAINYFSFKYPFYKFITEESVKKICEKYNLIYGEVGKYIGTVPEKNLKQLEEFKISEEDECYMEITIYISVRRTRKYPKYISFEEHENLLNREFDSRRNSRVHCDSYSLFYEKAPLEIAAPRKDFDMEDMEVTDYKLETINIPDPVVLKPVFFKDKKYYLVVTAWGNEASDEKVININHN